jgi:hypothetical protein
VVVTSVDDGAMIQPIPPDLQTKYPPSRISPREAPATSGVKPNSLQVPD